MNRCITLLLFILFSFSSFSQVVIKEKVALSPKIIIKDSQLSVNEHIFTYTMAWIPSETRRGSIQIVTCNGDTLNSGYSYSGSVTMSFPANGRHHYLFKPERYFYHNFLGYGWYYSELPGFVLQAFIDDIDLNQPQNVLGTYRGVHGSFVFNINGLICENGTISIYPYAYAECGGPNWYDTDPINLQITEGTTNFTFYNLSTGTNLGSSAQVDYSEVSNIILKRKENAPPFFTPQIVELEANINGVIGTTSRIYYPNNFVIRVPSYPDTLNNGNTGEIYVDIIHYCQVVPSQMKINIDIIDGTEFGNLIEPITGERVQSIAELDHYYGNANVSYIADGISASSTDSVIIRISTTDPDVPPKDITIYINPPPLAVTIEPGVLSAGDTASVIIKKRNPDGTLEDFPSEQTFEIGMLEGCIQGDILVNVSLGYYFPDAQLPVYFVAADSIDEDSGYVRLRIGTDLSNITKSTEKIKTIDKKQLIENEEVNIDGKIYKRAELIAGFDKLIAVKKSERLIEKNKKSEVLLTEGLLSDVCYTGEFLYEDLYWIGDVPIGICSLIRPLLCDDEAVRNSVITEVTNDMFTVTQEINNHQNGCNNTTDIGGWATANAVPYTGDFYVNYGSYYYVDEMMFSLSWGFCIDKINEVYSNPILIDYQNGVLTGMQNIIQKEEILEDFESILRGFSKGRSIKYYPLSITREHELKHISQYQDSLKKFYDIALEKINWIEEPPSDWCAPENIVDYLKKRKDDFNDFLKIAEMTFEKRMKESQSEREKEADNAGLEYLRNVLIPKVQRFPN